jgi:hypothetical protein
MWRPLDVLWISHRQSDGHPLQSFSLFFPLYTESKDPFASSYAKKKTCAVNTAARMLPYHTAKQGQYHPDNV